MKFVTIRFRCWMQTEIDRIRIQTSRKTESRSKTDVIILVPSSQKKPGSEFDTTEKPDQYPNAFKIPVRKFCRLGFSCNWKTGNRGVSVIYHPEETDEQPKESQMSVEVDRIRIQSGETGVLI